MKTYRKIIDGKRVRKARNQIVIIKDGRQYINPSEQMLIEDGWEAVTEEQENALDVAKRRLKSRIERYDSSDKVNGFSLQETHAWLDKSTRAGLMLRLQAEQAIGKTSTVLWYDNNQYELPLETAFQMLYALEVYASQCYDNTQRHLAAIQSLQTIEEVEKYDYTAGYPAQLEF